MVHGEGVEPCMCVCLQVWRVNGAWRGYGTMHVCMLTGVAGEWCMERV